MSRKLSVPSQKELEALYFQEGCTISSLAAHYNTSQPTARSWLKKYNIPRKSHKQASTEANNRHQIKARPSKDRLEELYESNSIDSLELYFSVGQQTIYQWLEDYDIPIKTLAEACKHGKERQYEDIQFDKDFIDRQYVRGEPLRKLADNLGISVGHARQQLIRNDIEFVPSTPLYRSGAEIELSEFLEQQFPDDDWEICTKRLITPYEIDIVNHDKKIAIEYGGLYWHSENSRGRGRGYHKKKRDMCKEVGYKLITILESDDQEKVRCLLLKLLGKTERVGARKTSVKPITPSIARIFHNKHHLHSFVGAKHHYGIYSTTNELLMVASFGHNRFNKDQQYECTRISSHSNITVVGGVSKIIKHFIRQHNPASILTFADLRFGDGGVYRHCGFEYIEDTPPNYWYSYKYMPPLYSRVKFQKHKLKGILETFDSSQTEYQNMVANGWDRVWDCGNAKFVYKKGGA
jgi:hypothetical protein